VRYAWPWNASMIVRTAEQIRRGAARPGRRHVRPGGVLGVATLALAAVGCSIPGPQHPASAVEPLRQSIQVGAPVDAQVSVLRSGPPDGQRLILVHGTPGAASEWADFLLDPIANLQVVALDRPGFGHSGPEGAVTSLQAQAAAVAALLPTSGAPAILLGHSMGGPIVARVAAEHPDRVAAVVLLAASLDPALESIHPMQRVGAWAPVRALLSRTMRNANAELMALKPELEDLAPLLPRISARVVIMHGTADDLVPVANVAYMQAHLTGARCVRTVLLDGRNHFLPWNSAADVREAVRMARDTTC